MAEPKTKQNDAGVEKFLVGIFDDTRREDSRVLCRLMTEATQQSPKMWGKNIIGFGTYRYKYASGREGEWMLTGFSPRKDSLTLYM